MWGRWVKGSCWWGSVGLVAHGIGGLKVGRVGLVAHGIGGVG